MTVRKHKYFSSNIQESKKRGKLFNAILKIAQDLKEGEIVSRKLSKLISEVFVAKGLARKIEHDLLEDYHLKVKIVEKRLQRHRGSKGKFSKRPTELEIEKLK